MEVEAIFPQSLRNSRGGGSIWGATMSTSVSMEMIRTIRTGPLSEIDDRYREDPHCNVSASRDRFARSPAILPIQFSRGSSL